MLTSGDVVDLDLGLPVEREAGFLRPAVLVTAETLFAASPNVVYVVPVTTRNRGFRSEVLIEPDRHNGLDEASVAQCRGCAKSWVLAVLALGVGLMLRGFPGLRSCHSW